MCVSVEEREDSTISVEREDKKRPQEVGPRSQEGMMEPFPYQLCQLLSQHCPKTSSLLARPSPSLIRLRFLRPLGLCTCCPLHLQFSPLNSELPFQTQLTDSLHCWEIFLILPSEQGTWSSSDIQRLVKHTFISVLIPLTLHQSGVP